MTPPRRCMLLATGAALSGAGMAGCAATSRAGAAGPTPFAGSAMAFSVRRIYCIGRNDAAHARESVDKIGGHFSDGAIWLKVNGTTKQNATLRHMSWSVPERIARLSAAFELMPGDIIDCGTPEIVGPVVRGDVIEIDSDRLPNLSVKVV